MLPFVFLSIVVMSYIGFTDSAIARKTDAEVIRIPAEIEPVLSLDGDIDVPKECRDKTYCLIKPDNYPQEQINNIVKENKVLPQQFISVKENTQSKIDIENRFGEDGENVNSCASRITEGPVFRVRRSISEKWQIVMQAPDQGYVQRIPIVHCENKNESCFNGIFLPITTICKEIEQEILITVIKGDDKFETMLVPLPLCCSCFYRENPIENRFGN